MQSEIFMLSDPSPDNGAGAEQIAISFLQRQDCQILERNFSASTGEIDIITRQVCDNQTVTAFVEVKFRRSDKYGGGLAAVDARKRQRLRKTALLWLQHYDPDERYPCRFDVIALQPKLGKLELIWLQGAF